MKIFIGSLSYNVTEDDLRQAFEAFGQVASANIIKDKEGKGDGVELLRFKYKEQCSIIQLAKNECRTITGRAVTKINLAGSWRKTTVHGSWGTIHG